MDYKVFRTRKEAKAFADKNFIQGHEVIALRLVGVGWVLAIGDDNYYRYYLYSGYFS